MTDDNSTDETDEQLQEYLDRDDFTIWIDGDRNWEARSRNGEVVDMGEVDR